MGDLETYQSNDIPANLTDELSAQSKIDMVKFSEAMKSGLTNFFSGILGITGSLVDANGTLKTTSESALISDDATMTLTSGANAFSSKDVCNDTTMTITGATNTTPIVITCTTHSLQTGDAVTIASVGGNTNANGVFVVTRLTADTFSLQDSTTLANIAGNGEYTSGGTAIRIMAFTLSEFNAQSGYIVKAQLITNQSTNTSGYKLHLYQTPPTAIADNAQFAILDANKAKRISTIVFPACATEGTGSDSASSVVVCGYGNLPLPFMANSDRKNIYGILETIDGFTSAASQTIYIKLTADII